MLRWKIKKLARTGMATGSWLSGRAPAINANRQRQKVRVLTYHRFGKITRDPFCIEPDDFEKQMRYLAEQGLIVSLADLQGFIAGKTVLPPGAVVVTVDDGFRSLYTTALPILKNYGIPATAFVSPGLIHATKGAPPMRHPASEEEYLSWDELAKLSEDDITIASHGWSHQSLGRMSIDEAEDEAARSREALESHLGTTVSAFAYPFGTVADFNVATASILAETGYRCAFTSQHGAISPGMDSYCLPRVKVESGERLWQFQLLLRGGLDGWSLIDRTLWRLQAAGR